MSGECDNCGECGFECLCKSDQKCALIHSKIPKMTENGYILKCKEGCDDHLAGGGNPINDHIPDATKMIEE